jgi:predicted ATPase/class 3 adenylate cyclase/Tfp pilus assembly protein PilF
MPDLPSGTVTFLFTDVEGSTRRWEEDSPAMRAAIERHFALLETAIGAHHGVRFKTIGDAVQAAFPTAPDAVRAAVAAQQAILAEDWGALGPLRVRMAIHTGDATPQDGDYLAPVLNRLARLIGAGHGGQILLSESTRLLVRDALPPELRLEDLGEHCLRDLREPERISQVNAPGLPAEFPPLKSLDRHRQNLPAQLTTFIGREEDVAAVRARFVEGGVRLLTLTGPGGTGKTRLALRVAEELAAEYPDGVWFVSLAPVSEPMFVAAAIAETLGLRESAGPVEMTLRAHLRGKQIMLVLDNFEHVIAAAPLVGSLLANAPGLRVLVTSRAPLRISGEQDYPVHPMMVPAGEAPTVAEAAAAEAVQLFIERATAVRPDFALTAENVAAVAAICRRLDGLPLAIELAAARVRLLSPEAILARLDSRLGLLTGGARDLPERQQTLRAAIAWSHDLLETAEQALFRRLAAFAGGWTLEAAETIAAAVAEPAVSVIDGLEILVDNSLVYQRDDPRQTRADDPRFAMLQTIREFGREQLAASGEEAAIRAAHGEYFLRLAVAAASELTGRDAVSWLDRLESDHDNLRATLAWFRQQADAARAVRLAGALWRFWWLRGHLSEGRGELEAALAVAAAGDPAPERAAALDGAGVLAETQGDFTRAETLHTEALELSRALADTAGTARATGNLGVVAFDRGDYRRALALLEESLALARAVDDRQMAATALTDLGRVHHAQDDLAKAGDYYRDSLALRRQLGGGTDIARSLHNLGVLALDREDTDQARTLFAESLELYRELGDTWGAAGALNGIAQATIAAGDATAAAPLLEESLARYQETGDTRGIATAMVNLATFTATREDRERAAEHYREALARFESVEDRAGMVDSLAGLGRLLVEDERWRGAATALGAAASLSEGGDPAAPADQDGFAAAIAQARAALHEDDFAGAWDLGRRLSPEAAADAAIAG